MQAWQEAYCHKHSNEVLEGIQNPSGWITHISPKILRKRLNETVIQVLAELLDTFPEFQPFLELPPKSELPDYYQVVVAPISLIKMKAKAMGLKYTSLSKIERDLSKMASNCRIYNGLNHILTVRALGLQSLVMMAIRRAVFLHQKKKSIINGNSMFDPDHWHIVDDDEFFETLQTKQLITSSYLASSCSESSYISDDDDDSNDESSTSSFRRGDRESAKKRKRSKTDDVYEKTVKSFEAEEGSVISSSLVSLTPSQPLGAHDHLEGEEPLDSRRVPLGGLEEHFYDDDDIGVE
eukprot:Platyproteum_vivax@DN680_c0_g1_i1.p1